MQKSKLYGRLRPFIRRPFKSIASITRRRLKYDTESGIQTATSMMPITKSVPEDVFIIGYPKSGNTWFRHLVTGAFYGVDPEYAPHALVNSLIPNMHIKRYYMRYQTPMFFKSHWLPKPRFRRVVYLLRDGRDVMVSYFHHKTNLDSKKDVDFLHMTKSGEELFPSKWHEHVETWLSNPFGAQMIVIRYEDLKKDAVHELQRFCQFLDIEREDAFLQTVVDKASFSKMQNKEKKEGWDNLNWRKETRFVRRGQVGSYIDEMPPAVLAAFLEDAGATLEKCGYLKQAEREREALWGKSE